MSIRNTLLVRDRMREVVRNNTDISRVPRCMGSVGLTKARPNYIPNCLDRAGTWLHVSVQTRDVDLPAAGHPGPLLRTDSALHRTNGYMATCHMCRQFLAALEWDLSASCLTLHLHLHTITKGVILHKK